MSQIEKTGQKQLLFSLFGLLIVLISWALVGVNYFCRLTTIIFAGSPLSFFGRSCCRDCVAGLLRCGSWAH